MKRLASILVAAALFVSSALAQSPPNTVSMVPNGGVTGTIASQNYAQGTWTPVITASTTAGTPAYAASGQVGSYEQIGRFVRAYFYVSLSGWTGTPSGNVTITGLPLTAANTTNDDGVCVVGFYSITGSAGDVGLTGFVTFNTSVINLVLNTQASTTPLTAAISGTTPTIIGTCFYHT